ncbi:late embryogenesis abundant protein Lea5-D-like [Curcuma longa]|uniref:late embryogenesis abundant protein Lea5-D-like n=1 Tax=Curcuma longa TaxID=136217 RepID=UPI003D9F18BD
MAARSLVGVAASLKNTIATPFASRMGYAAAAATVEIGGEKKAAVGQVVSNSTTTAVDASYVSASSSSWMPDPVTGYYRPGSRRKEAEAAELRETSLSYEQLN